MFNVPQIFVMFVYLYWLFAFILQGLFYGVSYELCIFLFLFSSCFVSPRGTVYRASDFMFCVCVCGCLCVCLLEGLQW